LHKLSLFWKAKVFMNDNIYFAFGEMALDIYVYEDFILLNKFILIWIDYILIMIFLENHSIIHYHTILVIKDGMMQLTILIDIKPIKNQ